MNIYKMEPDKERKCIMVLGMHRSGTSMVSGLLHVTGINLGKNLLLGDLANEKGYFENEKILNLNELILKEIESSWDDIRPLPADLETRPEIIIISAELKKIIEEEYFSSVVFGIKDPRLALFLPIYLKIFKDLKIIPYFILVERKTIEIAESLTKRDGFTYEKTVALTEKYRNIIKKHTKSVEHKIIVQYDDVLNEPYNFIKNIEKIFDIKLLSNNDDKNRIEGFASHGLKHHTINYDEVVMQDREEIGMVNRKILELEDDLKQKNNELTNVIGELQNEKNERQRSNAKLNSIENSFTWRLNRKFASLFQRNGRFGHFLIEIERMIASFFNKLFPPYKNFDHQINEHENILVDEQIARCANSGTYPNVDKFYNEDNPEVSIIIINFNKSSLTLNCLHCVWSHAVRFNYEVIVMDNGSSEQELTKLENVRGKFKLIKLGTNRFFGEANNIASEHSKGKYLVFLNNDAFVNEGWLTPLIKCLNEMPDCGVAGSKLIYPDGRLQEAGAMLSADGTSLQIGKGGDPNAPEFCAQKVVDYCSASSITIRKDVFEKVLGFDLVWEPVYYEDTDLCFKVRSIGLKVYYCPESEVVHIEGATSSMVKREMGLHNIVEVNRSKFVERWLSDNKFDFLIDNDEKLFKSNPNFKNVVLYSPYRIMMGGGERYLLNIASILSKNHNVYILTEHQYSRIRFKNLFREMGLIFKNIDLITADKLILIGEIDIFLCMGNEVLPPYKPIGAKNLFMCQFPFSLDGHYGIFRERQLWLNGYDSIIVNSSYTKLHYEKQLIKYTLGRKKIEIIAPPVDLSQEILNKNKKRGMIVSVGRFFGGAYTKGHLYMINAFKKMIDGGNVNAELHLVGSLHPESIHREYYLECRRKAIGYPIFFHIDASSSKLRKLYSEANIYWHATGIDANENTRPENMEHFGISIVEAMSFGCVPVVLGKGGPLEIVDNFKNGRYFLTLNELITISKDLILDFNSDKTLKIRELAISKSKLYDAKKFEDKILKLIKYLK